MKVEVIIEKDETNYYVAEAPALPGCFSQGKTLAEAEANIREAIELWVEVMNQKTVRPSVGKGKKDKKLFRKRIAVEI